MKKLLIVCPSRGRPFRIIDMIKTVEDTTDAFHTDMVVLLDKDDPCLGQYEEKLPTWVKVRVYDRTGDKTLTTEIINRAFQEFNNYEFYSVTNDDIHYKTKGWDVELCQKMKISCGQDDTMVEKYGNQNVHTCPPGDFPITSVIDGDICRAIGWLQMPELIHSCGDNIWYWIGRRSDILYVDRNYHTDHVSPYFGRAEVDETFEKSNTIDNKADYYTYKEWLKYKCGRELIKVDRLLKESASCLEAYQEA